MQEKEARQSRRTEILNTIPAAIDVSANTLRSRNP